MKHFVVTVGCEYGSGGIEIGKMVAKSLGVEYYDRDLIDKHRCRRRRDACDRDGARPCIVYHDG